MSFAKYPEYKDSGDASLGQIPKHWRVVRIGDVAKVVNDYPFDSALFQDDGAYPLIRIRDLGVSETATRYNGDFVEAAAVTSSDVLIGMDGDFNVGRWFGTGTALLNQRMCCLRTPSADLTKLLEYALPQPLRVINDLTYATTVKHLSSSQIEKIRLSLAPDQGELRTIVGFLDHETAKIDALVAEQEKLIALLQEKRQAVISHAVTKGLNPNVPMKDSGMEWLGEVPGHWEVKRLRNLATLNPSKSEVSYLPRDTEVSFLPMEAVGDDGTLNLDRTRPITEVESGYTYFREGDVTIAKITPCFENGKGAVMRGLHNGHGFGTTELIVVRPCESKTTSNYLHLLFTSRPFRLLGESFMYGAGGQKRVPDDFVRDPSVALPPLAEQEEINAFLDCETAKLDTLMAEARTAITLLQERRTALISAAVTGQIDVRGLAGAFGAPDSIAGSAYA